MTKFLIGLLGAGALATGGYAAATNTDADPARTVSLPGATTSDDTTTAVTTASATTATTAEDVSGPCDEAEHADEARCTGANATTPVRTTVPGTAAAARTAPARTAARASPETTTTTPRREHQ